jgi:N utilization substance protein A
VVVNDDQLSLAIGKRGQNVRLAARLTGWDIDILTPAEFQRNVKRLEETLKAIEGVTGEMVDKCIALGLIHVADIEEVGTGPLMEELGMDEALAEKTVEICSEVAKVVAVEDTARKEAEAKAKAASAADSKRALDALLGLSGGNAAGESGAAATGGEPGVEGEPSAPVETSNNMPGTFEASNGAAPEITVHSQSTGSSGDDLSPEEQAISGVEQGPTTGSQETPDEGEDVAALAEGRADAPRDGGSEPA